MSPTSKKKPTLLQTFDQLPKAQKLRLSEIVKPLELSLITLYIAKKEASTTELTSEHIEACLEMAGVAIRRESVTKSLSKAGAAIKTTRMGPDTFYKIMTKGEVIAEQALSAGGIQVVSVVAGTPRTSRRELDDILRQLNSSVCICDPYYGVNTLDSLENIPKTTAVRFLTQKTSEDRSKLSRQVKDFKKEHGNVTIRIADSQAKLHDRYIVDSACFHLVGHGLKDLGNKDSFIISLEAKLVPDLVQQMQARFEEHWKTGTDL